MFLVLESPLFHVIFMKNHVKNPLFDFFQTKLWIFLGTWGTENLSDYVFCVTFLVYGMNFFGPYPFKVTIGNRSKYMEM